MTIADFRAYHWARAGIGSPAQHVIETLKWEELEDRYDDDAHCQALHRDPRNRACSVEVVAAFTSCDGVRTVCANTAAHVRRTLTEPYAVCNMCDYQPCANHWRVTDI